MNQTRNDDDPWSSGDEDDDELEVDDDEDDNFTFYSICSHSANDTLELALKYDLDQFGFDLLTHLPSSNDDDFFEGTIILVNKCRQFVKDTGEEKAAELGNELNEFLKNQQVNLENDMAYYKPVLEDDAILMCIDELQELKRKSENVGGEESQDGSQCNTPKTDSETIRRLQAQVSLLEEKLSHAKECIVSLANDEESRGDDISTNTKTKKKSPDNDTYYFSSYSNTSIHETMLRDTVRTAAYEEAILSNAESLFRGRTVLDIGCGTGVLSLFCAKAGAKKVIAVDNSDIIDQATQIVKLNGFEDVVTCVRGKIETLIEKSDLPLANGETVDIIVSEWMGYALFFETMLPSGEFSFLCMSSLVSVRHPDLPLHPYS